MVSTKYPGRESRLLGCHDLSDMPCVSIFDYVLLTLIVACRKGIEHALMKSGYHTFDTSDFCPISRVPRY